MLIKKRQTRRNVTPLSEEVFRDVLKQEIQSSEKRFENKVLEFKDAILKEIKDMRDEVAIVGVSRDMIEDHDQRIETIEKHFHIQPAA